MILEMIGVMDKYSDEILEEDFDTACEILWDLDAIVVTNDDRNYN